MTQPFLCAQKQSKPYATVESVWFLVFLFFGRAESYFEKCSQSLKHSVHERSKRVSVQNNKSCKNRPTGTNVGRLAQTFHKTEETEPLLLQKAASPQGAATPPPKTSNAIHVHRQSEQILLMYSISNLDV